MSKDRPLFDDEWLPGWLTDAGITSAGPSAESLAQQRPQTGGLTMPDPFANAVIPPVRTGGTAAVPRWMEQAPGQSQEIDAGVPAWMQRGSLNVIEPSSLPLPMWMRRKVEDAAAPISEPDLSALPMPDLDAFAPPQPSGAPQTVATPKYTAETLDPLPWLPGVSNPLDQPVPIAMTDSNWLSETSDPANPPGMNTAGDEADRNTGEQPAQPGPRGLRRLVKPSTGELKGETSQPATPPPNDAANLTYEAWERTQAEQAQAPQHQTDEELLGAVPDWLATVENPSAAEPPASSVAGGPEFMPDWFAGLEEQSQNAAPDWFNPAEIANTPLTGPTNVPIISEPVGTDAGSPVDALALDWMSDLPDLPGFSTVESPVELSPESTSLPLELPPAETGATDDIPTWMRELNPDESAVPPSSGGTPDWLADVPRVSDHAPVASHESAEVPAADLPEWLAALQPGVSNEAPLPAEADPSPSGQLNLGRNVSSADIDALMSLPMVSHVEPDPVPSPSMPLDPGSLSLEESDLDSILGPMPAAATPEAAPPAEIGPKVPHSRRTGLSRAVETHTANAPKPPAEPEVAPVRPATALPEFVADMRPSDVPVQFKIGGVVEIGVEEAPLSQLTDQLRQLRDHALAFKPPEPPPTASAGPLADLAGPLAVEPVIVRAATSASPSAISAVGGASDAQLRRVDVIRRLLEIEGTESTTAGASRPKAAARPAARVNVERLIVSLILLALLIAPFFTHVLNVVTPPDTSAPTAAQSAVFNAMDGLVAKQPIMVAFEYGPTGAGELDDLARDLLHDLFKHGAKPVIVSTDFAGAMHAESLLSTFGHDANELQALNRTADQPLLARTDYVVLRYLPAGAAGVRTMVSAVYRGGLEAQTEFTTDLEGQISGLSLSDLAALRNGPVIVLAETPEDVRNWAEQYRAPADASAVPAKIILATSAAADATASTYSAALPQTIIGPLVGLRDATLYEELRQPPTTPTATDRLLQRWQSVGLGAWAAAGLILFGALFGLLGSFRRREARR
ncbi:MAG: hypothetical protein ACYDBJ_01805 [Aggregatilineales bacterium]